MSSTKGEPGEHDVLCGRGATTNQHQGNVRFRAVVAEHQPRYVEAKKEEKEGIARTIIATIQKRGGKFLGKNGEGEWVEVDFKKALLKTSQALREGMNVRGNASPAAKMKKSPTKAAAGTPAAASKPPAPSPVPTPKLPPPAPIAPRSPAKIHTSKTVSSGTKTSDNGTLNDDDVLCGRGGGTNAYVGNIRFRTIVSEHQPRYLYCKRADKEQIAAQIVTIVRQRGGRFLSKNSEGQWEEIGEKKAILKSSQALREGMNVRGGTLKSPERSSKFAAAMMSEEKKQQKSKPVKDDATTVIAMLPNLPRSQLEAVTRAMLCSGSKDAVAAAVAALNATPDSPASL